MKTRLILGDLIISSKDHRILTCHHGTILYELLMNQLVTSILSYYTIEDEQLFLFIKEDTQSIDLFSYDQNHLLNPFLNTNETANYILIDDFSQIGWKQILFLKNDFNPTSFFLTDFSQIHIFQQELDYEYNVCKIILNDR